MTTAQSSPDLKKLFQALKEAGYELASFQGPGDNSTKALVLFLKKELDPGLWSVLQNQATLSLKTPQGLDQGWAALSSLVKEYAQLKEQGLLDLLTGLYNRRHFENLLKTELARMSHYRYELSLLLLKITSPENTLKDLEPLKTIAELLAQHTRMLDEAARYSVDTLALILPGTSFEAALRLARRLQKLLESQEFLKKEALTVNLGLAVNDSRLSLGPKEFCQKAEEALLKAPINQGVGYDESYTLKAEAHLQSAEKEALFAAFKNLHSDF